MDKRLDELKDVVFEQALEHTRRLLTQILYRNGLPRPNIFPATFEGDEPYDTVQVEFVSLPTGPHLLIDADGHMTLYLLDAADTVVESSDVLDIIPYLQEVACSRS